MTTVADMVLDGKPKTYEGQELRTSDVILCAAAVEKQAVEAFIARPRVTEAVVRAWLAENRAGSDTPRADFDEAVRRYLITRWNIS